MRRALLPLVLAACASSVVSDHVPGGGDLPEPARLAYRAALALARRGDVAGGLTRIERLCEQHPETLGFQLQRIEWSRRVRGAEATAAIYDAASPGMDPDRAGVLAELSRLPDDDLDGRRSAVQYAVEKARVEADTRHRAAAPVERERGSVVPLYQVAHNVEHRAMEQGAGLVGILGGGRTVLEDKVLNSKPGHFIEPAFSPDGKTVVYRAVRGGYLRSPQWSLRAWPSASSLSAYCPT